MIRFRFSANGVFWFSPDRKWLPVNTDERTREFLMILHNVTKGYNN